MRASKSLTLVLISLISILMAGGCNEKNQYVAPPPPSVTVAMPLQKDIVEYLEFTGTTQSIASVDIRARVQGFLQSIHFREGANVKKGDLLYVIEPSMYQATLDRALGDLAAKKAQLDRAEVEYQRNLRLMKENATSDRELNNSKAARDAAKADVMVADANVDTARINLGYTTVRSPLNGTIGRSMVDIGNLVGAGEFTLLTNVKQYDPIYAYFSLNERDLLMIMRRYRNDPKAKATEEIPVFLGLADEKDYPHQGRLDFVDPGLDQTTGTILLRALFPNPSPPLILPGLFVRLRVPVGKEELALLVPERAIGVDQLGQYVLVVGKDNIVEHRPVRIGALEGGYREIKQGIRADDRVVVNGLQRARPGLKVNPVEAGQAEQSAAPKGPGGSSPAKP